MHIGGMQVVGTMRVVLGVGLLLLVAIRHQLHSALGLGRRQRRKTGHQDNIAASEHKALHSPGAPPSLPDPMAVELSDSWNGESMLKVSKGDKGNNKCLTGCKRAKIRSLSSVIQVQMIFLSLQMDPCTVTENLMSEQ